MNKILVEVSARHLHLTQEQVEILFGAGHQLTAKKDLSQPGQFACEEKVEVVGPKSSLKMSVLGPARSHAQVELALTDARTLGLSAPIRESGDVKGSTAVTLKGPNGEVTIDEGVIIAKRHIHMTPEDAKTYNVENGQIVNVKVETAERTTVFADTVIRVSDKFSLAMHVDTDEANAAGISGSALGELVTIS